MSPMSCFFLLCSTSSGVLGDGEKQLGAFFKAHPGAREKVFLCTKFVYTITNGQ